VVARPIPLVAPVTIADRITGLPTATR
jgi:hypothetical protein